MAPPFLYTTIVVDKVNGHGLSNIARRERLPKKTGISYSRTYQEVWGNLMMDQQLEPICQHNVVYNSIEI